MKKEPTKETTYLIPVLKYKKGELILKEGDYGISIYKIINGKVTIYTEAEDVEIPLATLGQGEVIGEINFLSKLGERRSASGRAVEDTELEVWHPTLLVEEYERMPPIMQYIADQALNRLIRMNRLIAKVSISKKKTTPPKTTGNWEEKRSFYRKDVALDCVCRSVDTFSEWPFQGKIKDLSFGGLAVEISARNIKTFPFQQGDEIAIKTVLPNGKEFDAIASIRYIREGEETGKLLVGMSFTDLSEKVRKNLGFFLMP